MMVSRQFPFSTHKIRWLVLVACLCCVSSFLVASPVPACPAHCECSNDEDLQTATCTDLQWNEIAYPNIEVLVLRQAEPEIECNISENIHLLFPQLNAIVLRNCSLTYLPSHIFRHLKFLEGVDLSHNSIRKFNHSLFTANTKLRWVDLAHNPLHITSHALLSSDSIWDIDLSSCDISHLPSAIFKGISSLRYLSLADNRLQTVQEGTLPTALTILNLSGNQISNVPLLELNRLKELKLIDLSHNPVNCTCELMGFQNWVSGKGTIFRNGIECALPAEYAGYRLVNVPEYQMCDAKVQHDSNRILPHHGYFMDQLEQKDNEDGLIFNLNVQNVIGEASSGRGNRHRKRATYGGSSDEEGSGSDSITSGEETSYEDLSSSTKLTDGTTNGMTEKKNHGVDATTTVMTEKTVDSAEATLTLITEETNYGADITTTVITEATNHGAKVTITVITEETNYGANATTTVITEETNHGTDVTTTVTAGKTYNEASATSTAVTEKIAENATVDISTTAASSTDDNVGTSAKSPEDTISSSEKYEQEAESTFPSAANDSEGISQGTYTSTEVVTSVNLSPYINNSQLSNFTESDTTVSTTAETSTFGNSSSYIGEEATTIPPGETQPSNSPDGDSTTTTSAPEKTKESSEEDNGTGATSTEIDTSSEISPASAEESQETETHPSNPTSTFVELEKEKNNLVESRTERPVQSEMSNTQANTSGVLYIIACILIIAVALIFLSVCFSQRNWRVPARTWSQSTPKAANMTELQDVNLLGPDTAAANSEKYSKKYQTEGENGQTEKLMHGAEDDDGGGGGGDGGRDDCIGSLSESQPLTNGNNVPQIIKSTTRVTTNYDSIPKTPILIRKS